MLYTKTNSTNEPSRVVIEKLPDNVKIVRLADHIARIEDEEGGEHYEYDEVVFEMPADREDTIDEITANFDAWWIFGQVEQEEISLEQRVSDLEEIILGLIEG